MKKFYLLGFFLFIFGFAALPQSIWTNNVAGNTTTSPYTTGDVVDPGITESGITAGPSITLISTASEYNAKGWNAGAISNAYFEFTITPNSGCNINFVSFVYTSTNGAGGPSSFAIRSSIDGFVANIGAPNATGTTISLAAAAYQNISSSITFRFYGWGATSGNKTFGINDFTFNGVATCPTITTGAVSPSTINLASCAATATAVVTFTSTGTYNAGNYYTVWLSDFTGSFGTATNVGTLTSTANTGTITITIPAGIAPGTNYMVQIASYLPAVVGSNSSPFTVSTPCVPAAVPISGIMSNYTSISTSNSAAYGCDNGCDESAYAAGPFYHPAVCNNDNVVGCASCSSVSQSITFTISAGCTYSAQAEFKARGASCPDAAMDGGDKMSITGTGGTIMAQSATLTSPGACSGISAGVNSYATANIPTGCGNADGLVKFVYKSPAAVTAQITISFTSDRSDEVLTFSVTASSYLCSIIVLPVELLGFYAAETTEGIRLTWVTATETNNDYFMVEYSLDAVNFIPFTSIKGAGNSYEKKVYTCIFTENTGNNIPYFRLKQVDYNGAYKYSTVITLGNYIGMLSSNGSTLVSYYNTNKDKIVAKFHLESPSQVTMNLYDLTGKNIYETTQIFNEGDQEMLLTAPDKAGVYFLVYQNTNGSPVHKKIIVNK